MSVAKTVKISSQANANSPFLQLATEFNIDPNFAYATWALETGYGTSELWINRNNPAGIIKLDGSGEYQTYATREDGLRAMFELLSIYCSNGNCTVGGIRSRWSEADDTDLIISIWKSVIKV